MKPFQKVLMVSGGIALLLLTIAALAYALTDIPSAAASLKENEAKARAAGLFITPQEYIDSITVPDSENAASIIAPVLREYEAKYKEAKFEDTSKKTINRSLVLAAYADLAPEWRQIDEAAKFKYCIFPRDRTILPATRYTEYPFVKAIIKLLAMRSKIAVERNELEVADTCWRRAASLSLILDDEPNLMMVSARISSSSVIYEAIRVGLRDRGVNEGWRGAAWNALTLLDQPYDYQSALRFEHVSGIQGVSSFFDKEPIQPLDDGYSDVFEDNFRWEAKIPRIRNATISRVHELSTGLFTRINAQPFDTTSIDAASKWFDALPLDSPSYRIARFVLPITSSDAKYITRDYARRNTLMQAIKLLENPTAKDLPLKGRYAIDSDGSPLRLLRKPNKLIIYSIGPNDIDDGGILEKPTKGYTRDYDFGIEIAR